MLKGFLLAVAVALLAAGCMGDDGGGGDGGSVSASEGESLVLQQEDVGSEFTQFDSGEQQRADFSPRGTTRTGSGARAAGRLASAEPGRRRREVPS